LGHFAEQLEEAPGSMSTRYGDAKGTLGLYCLSRIRNEKLNASVCKTFGVGDNLDIRLAISSSDHDFTAFPGREYFTCDCYFTPLLRTDLN
jgi:hypothetical protein